MGSRKFTIEAMAKAIEADAGEVLAEGLCRRGIAEPDANLTAEAGIAVFRVVGESGQRSFGEIVSESLARPRALAAIG